MEKKTGVQRKIHANPSVNSAAGTTNPMIVTLHTISVCVHTRDDAWYQNDTVCTERTCQRHVPTRDDNTRGKKKRTW